MKDVNSIIFKLYEGDSVYAESDHPVTLREIVNCIAVLIFLLPKEDRKELIKKVLDSVENGVNIVSLEKDNTNK